MYRAKLKIRQLAQKIIDNEVDFVEGCREIARVSHHLKITDFENIERDFLFIRGIASESDRFPIGDVRNTCSPEHLEELDLDKQDFTAFYSPQVLDSCQNIIYCL